jgi:hypothetical protein
MGVSVLYVESSAVSRELMHLWRFFFHIVIDVCGLVFAEDRRRSHIRALRSVDVRQTIA